MRYKDSVAEAIWIERTVNNKTYKEISEKLGISIYKIKKVINERLQKENSNQEDN